MLALGNMGLPVVTVSTIVVERIYSDPPCQPVHINPDCLAMIIRDELRGLMALGVDIPAEMVNAVAEAILRRAMAPQE